MKLDTAHVSFLEDAFRYASEETRSRVADAFYSLLNDAARTLAKNTAETDVEWFARELRPATFDTMPAQERELWRDVARQVINLLPDYQLRVAERLIQMAKVTSEIAAAERKRLKKAAREVADGADTF